MPQKPEIPPKPPIDNDVQKSIEIITTCRDNHASWIRAIESGRKTPEQIEVAGDIEWHQQWVDDYNFVIKTLKSKQ